MPFVNNSEEHEWAMLIGCLIPLKIQVGSKTRTGAIKIPPAESERAELSCRIAEDLESRYSTYY